MAINHGLPLTYGRGAKCVTTERGDEVKESQIKLYYKNVLSEVIGRRHGINLNAKQWKALARRTEKLIPEINKERQRRETCYGRLPYDESFARSVKGYVREFQDKCDNLVVLGIGGSALGNIALHTALNPYMHNLDDRQRRGPRLFVFDNVDPDQFGSFLKWLDKEDQLRKTVFNVISKSGTAAETVAQFLIIRKLFTEPTRKELLKDHVVITTGYDNEGTDKQSPLLKIARDEKLPLLEVPEGVGGRFSVLSPVGLFSACFCGIDIDSLLAGARDMDRRCRRRNFEKNPAAIYAAINYHYYNRGKRITVMMPYSYALKDFADWFRQLWAESLGKAKTLSGNEVHVGPTPVKALGATDQHSQVQLYREGPNDKIFTFLQVEQFNRKIKTGPNFKNAHELDYLKYKDLGTLLNVEKRATEYALLQDRRPCMTILFPGINAYTLGQFIFLLEVATSFTGALFNVNTYNQDAVELGKKATAALMGKTGPYKKGMSYEQFAAKIRAKTEIDRRFLV